MSSPKISIITATYNSASVIPQLIKSLEMQSNKSFEWLVSDGGSTDGTLELIRNIKDVEFNIVSFSDFGIYDALNRALIKAKADYYLVVGSDDELNHNAVMDFISIINDNHDADIIAAKVVIGGNVVNPGKGPSWLYGQFKYVSSHAVGTLFRLKLHETYGYYSNKFPIAADQLFIKTCCNNSAKLLKVDFVAGTFGLNGVSAIDVAGTLSEFFRVQLMTEEYKLLQFVIYIIRLIKNIHKIIS